MECDVACLLLFNRSNELKTNERKENEEVSSKKKSSKEKQLKYVILHLWEKFMGNTHIQSVWMMLGCKIEGEIVERERQ